MVNKNETIFVSGVLEYSKLAKPFNSEDGSLGKRIQQQQSFGNKFPTIVPHYTITISNPQIVDATSQDAASLLQSKIYQKKDGTYALTSDRKAVSKAGKEMYLPVFKLGASREDTPERFELPNEVEPGQEVILAYNTYENTYGGANGSMLVGLQAVYVKNDVRLFGSGGASAANFKDSQVPDRFFVESNDDEDFGEFESYEQENNAFGGDQGFNQNAQAQNNPFGNQQPQNNPFGNQQGPNPFDSGSNPYQ